MNDKHRTGKWLGRVYRFENFLRNQRFHRGGGWGEGRVERNKKRTSRVRTDATFANTLGARNNTVYICVRDENKYYDGFVFSDFTVRYLTHLQEFVEKELLRTYTYRMRNTLYWNGRSVSMENIIVLRTDVRQCYYVLVNFSARRRAITPLSFLLPSV